MKAYSYFSAHDKVVIDFRTPVKLFNASWVKEFSAQHNFYRFSLDRSQADYCVLFLMAEYDNGRKWNIVAAITEYDLELLKGLPEWVAVEDKK